MATIPTIYATQYTDASLATNEAKVDISSKAWESFGELTPLTTMLSKVSAENAFNFRVDLLERNEMPVALTNAGAVASGGTTVTISSGYAACVEGTLLYNPRAGDIARVSSTPTSASITVTRSVGGTTGAAWVAGDILFLLPTAIVEGETEYIEGASAIASNVYNYVQVTRLGLNLARIIAKVQTVTGGTMRDDMQTQKYREFRMRKELGLCFGGRASSGASSTPATFYRTAGGLRHFLVSGTNYKDFGGSFSESSWDDFLNDYFTENYDAGEVYCYIGPNAKNKIIQFAKGKGRVTLDKSGSNYYGFKIDSYDYDGKMVNLVRCPLWNQSPITSNSGFLIDWDRVIMKTLDADTLYQDIVGMKSEIISDVYRGVFSFLIANENKHAMFVGC